MLPTDKKAISSNNSSTSGFTPRMLLLGGIPMGAVSLLLASMIVASFLDEYDIVAHDYVPTATSIFVGVYLISIALLVYGYRRNKSRASLLTGMLIGAVIMVAIVFVYYTILIG